MIFSENRCTLFRIMRYFAGAGGGEDDGKRFFSLSTSCTFSLKPPPGMMMSPGF
jgi:hypothetical protein